MHDDLHLMPPTASFLVDDTRRHERMDRRNRLFALLRRFVQDILLI